jgi:hypothetical protein
MTTTGERGHQKSKAICRALGWVGQEGQVNVFEFIGSHPGGEFVEGVDTDDSP